MSRMRVRPSAPGTKALSLDSIWCRRVSRKGDTVDHSRILLGTLRTILRDEDGERIARDTTQIAPGVRRRAA